ncbi:hypothetical protein T484DRAFT_1755538 [Baffinella frigidus]|nr:hypothetical protein T484DRAFT_1755538 [Cryptophyta sp. CCMP2293]
MKELAQTHAELLLSIAYRQQNQVQFASRGTPPVSINDMHPGWYSMDINDCFDTEPSTIALNIAAKIAPNIVAFHPSWLSFSAGVIPADLCVVFMWMSLCEKLSDDSRSTRERDGTTWEQFVGCAIHTKFNTLEADILGRFQECYVSNVNWTKSFWVDVDRTQDFVMESTLCRLLMYEHFNSPGTDGNLHDKVSKLYTRCFGVLSTLQLLDEQGEAFDHNWFTSGMLEMNHNVSKSQTIARVVRWFDSFLFKRSFFRTFFVNLNETIDMTHASDKLAHSVADLDVYTSQQTPFADAVGEGGVFHAKSFVRAYMQHTDDTPYPDSLVHHRTVKRIMDHFMSDECNSSNQMYTVWSCSTPFLQPAADGMYAVHVQNIITELQSLYGLISINFNPSNFNPSTGRPGATCSVRFPCPGAGIPKFRGKLSFGNFVRLWTRRQTGTRDEREHHPRTHRLTGTPLVRGRINAVGASVVLPPMCARDEREHPQHIPHDPQQDIQNRIQKVTRQIERCEKGAREAIDSTDFDEDTARAINRCEQRLQEHTNATRADDVSLPGRLLQNIPTNPIQLLRERFKAYDERFDHPGSPGERKLIRTAECRLSDAIRLYVGPTGFSRLDTTHGIPSEIHTILVCLDEPGNYANALGLLVTIMCKEFGDKLDTSSAFATPELGPNPMPMWKTNQWRCTFQFFMNLSLASLQSCTSEAGLEVTFDTKWLYQQHDAPRLTETPSNWEAYSDTEHRHIWHPHRCLSLFADLFPCSKAKKLAGQETYTIMEILACIDEHLVQQGGFVMNCCNARHLNGPNRRTGTRLSV